MMKILLFLFWATTIIAQNFSIVEYLKKVESGQAENVRQELPILLKEHPNDPSVIFLDAVLTEEGETALEKYKKLYNEYPQSQFADAALYRIFSYYFALGFYKKAEEYLNKLKDNYPSSPYIKAADRSIPEEEIDNSLTLDEKEEIKQVAPSTKTGSSESLKYTVQAGAFLNYKNAERLKKNFQKAGYYSSIYPKEVGGSILNVVVVGKFKTEAEASAFLPKLKSQYKLNGRVTSLK